MARFRLTVRMVMCTVVSLFCAEVRVLCGVTCRGAPWDCTLCRVEVRFTSWCHLQRSALACGMWTGIEIGDVAGYAGRRVPCYRRNSHVLCAAGHRRMVTSCEWDAVCISSSTSYREKTCCIETSSIFLQERRTTTSRWPSWFIKTRMLTAL